VNQENNNEILPEQTDAPEEIVTAPLPKKKRKKVWLIILLSLLGLLIAVCLAVVIFAGNKLKLIQKGSNWEKPNQQEIDDFMAEQTDPIPDDATQIDPDDIEWGENAETIQSNSHIVNILLIGLDRRPGERYGRTDTMILCTLNKHNKTVTLTSIMRDLYVQIPGYYGHRINTCYFLGGTPLLDKTLETNFGVKIDGNIEVDMESFVTCIDTIGGIDLELSWSEANSLIRTNQTANPSQPIWELKAGMNHLNGAQALTYARNRSIGNGDFDRTTRQKKVIAAVFNKVKTMDFYEVNDLMNQFLPHLTTDMTNKQIIDHGWTVFGMFDQLQIKNARIPADGAFYGAYVSGMSVLVPNLEKNRAVFAEIMKVE